MIASRIKLQCHQAKSNNGGAFRRILCHNTLKALILAFVTLPYVSGFQTTFTTASCCPRDHTESITCLQSTASDITANKNTFDVDKALFCAGLAFDAYVEPDPDSSRWERGVSSALFHAIKLKQTREIRGFPSRDFSL